MNDEVIVICPELASGSGGLADYTRRLVEQWNGKFQLRFILPRGGNAHALSSPNFKVDVVERNSAALLEKLPSHGGKVLLQYSAYGFDHFGYPRWLLQALANWKDTRGSLVVMLHEIWTFWPVLNKNYPIQRLHRRDLRTLLARADAVFTSTASQAEHLGKLEPTANVEVLPVGSNIRPRSGLPAKRETGLAVLFGLQGARLRTLHTMGSDLQALASASLLTKLATVGGSNTPDGDREELELLGRLKLSRGVEQAGALAENEISDWLGHASFGISAQDELSLTKSSTCMAYAAHGLNILSPVADASKPEPLCRLVSPAELLRGMSADELANRAEDLRAWQERVSSWSAIADRFAAALIS